jgi:hypothetical protein
MQFRDLPALERRSLDLWIARAQAENPAAVLRRAGEPRAGSFGEVAVPLEDGATGARYEVLVWPDGAVNGLRELA